jgi:hypothetical protein
MSAQTGKNINVGFQIAVNALNTGTEATVVAS